MFKFVQAQLDSGRVFATEADLQKYLNGLRGYLTRKQQLPKTWQATQGRILARYRRGQLVAKPSEAASV